LLNISALPLLLPCHCARNSATAIHIQTKESPENAPSRHFGTETVLDSHHQVCDTTCVTPRSVGRFRFAWYTKCRPALRMNELTCWQLLRSECAKVGQDLIQLIPMADQDARFPSLYLCTGRLIVASRNCAARLAWRCYILLCKFPVRAK
jgi:hypothetical protein